MRLDLFSNPFEGNFPALADTYAARVFRGTLNSVNNFAAQIGAPRLPIDTDTLTPDRLGVDCWRPELGSAITALREGSTRDDWSWLQGQMLVSAFLSGLVPSLDLEIVGRHPVAIAGRIVKRDRLVIRADVERLTVEDGSGEALLRLTKVALDGIAPVWARDREKDLLRMGSGSVALLSKAEWMSHWKPAEAPPLEYTADMAASRKVIEDSMTVLEERSPALYLWSALVLREVVLLKTPPMRGTPTSLPTSQSFLNWPAQVQISQSTLLKTILMLVHESSHQYFNLFWWSMPLLRSEAPEDYSAIKQTNRPLERILLGYHAFANILLALPLLRGAHPAIKDSEIEEELAEYRPIVADLDDKLQKHEEGFLDAGGKALYLPLRRRLAVADPAAYATA